MVCETFPSEPFSGSQFREEVHGILFQQTRPHPGFDISPASVFEDETVYSCPVQQEGKAEARGPRTDNGDGGFQNVL